jgi:hypothetical protein
MAVQIQWRRDTAANWTAANPVLAAGEAAYETDTNKFKLGNGSTAWNSLAYGGLSGVMNNPVITGAGQETIVVSGTGFAGYTFDVISGAVQYITANATANGALAIRGNSTTTLNSFMATNTAISIILDITNGSSAYYPTSFTIDGTSVTPKWNGGTAPTGGNASSIDRYAFTIVKTASATYTVYATQVKFA